MKDDFDRLVRVSPRLFEAVRALCEKRLDHHLDIDVWRSQADRYVNALSIQVTERDMKEAVAKQGHSGAAFAIVEVGAVVGISTLLGFLAGLFVKSLGS